MGNPVYIPCHHACTLCRRNTECYKLTNHFCEYAYHSVADVIICFQCLYNKKPVSEEGAV